MPPPADSIGAGRGDRLVVALLATLLANLLTDLSATLLLLPLLATPSICPEP